jgi:tRNA-2-methylthio-N6-dimethylallyladenosine synthase
MPGKVYIKTFGCQMNAYDSAKMADILAAERGYMPTQDPDEADVILVNTCSIREKAQEKLFSQLGHWRAWKDGAPGRILGVGGCVASQEGEAIQERADHVDIVFGPQTLHRLPELIDEARTTRAPVVDIRFPEIEKFDRLPAPHAEGPSAFVSIMEGCSKYCSFCVVPYTRGEEISRPLEDVLAEVIGLSEVGVREINLLGQNVNAYAGRSEDGDPVDLATLLYYLAAIDGIERLRFTTSHPREMTPALIEAYEALPALVSHLHLPVQSGSDTVLARMKRGYTALEYRQIIRRLRAARPDISISSDFIVGFPGETEQDFQATMDLVEAIRFDHSFSFIYSPRPGTPAADLPDPVPPEVKKARLERLQQRLGEQAQAIGRGLVGTRQTVLVERAARRNPGEVAGRTPHNWVVNFPGSLDALRGRLVDVLITEAHPNSLRGVADRDRAPGAA